AAARLAEHDSSRLSGDLGSAVVAPVDHEDLCPGQGPLRVLDHDPNRSLLVAGDHDQGNVLIRLRTSACHRLARPPKRRRMSEFVSWAPSFRASSIEHRMHPSTLRY